MPKTKILYFSHSPYLFGAENCLVTLVQALDRQKFQAAVVLPADGPLKLKLDALGIPTHIFPLEWWVRNEGRFLYPENELSQRLDQLLRLVAEEQPDIIHTNTSVVWLGAVTARMLGIRHVWHLHEMLVDHPSLQPIFPIPLMYEAIDFLSESVVTVSDELRRELVGYGTSAKLRVIHNGVTASKVESDRAEATRSSLDAEGKRTIAVTVTSLQKYKGIADLLATAVRVVEKRPDVLFVIAGTGPKEAVLALNKGVKELGLENSVLHLGFSDNVPQLLAAADLFVLPSLKEAFPLVVLEAMAQGKVVVTTDCGGTAEMVVDGETGFLVPVGDSGALADRIIELAASPERRAALGAAGQLRFTTEFTADGYVNSFEKLYCDLMAAPQPVASTKQLSFMNSLLSAYQKYSFALRALQENETAHKQLSELRAALEERDRVLQRKDDSLSQLEQELADLDGRLEQLAGELVCAGKVQAELERWVDHKATEVENRSDRLKKIKTQVSALSKERNELASVLQQKDVELAERDQRLQQLEEEVGREGLLVEEQLRRKEQELARVQQALDAEQKCHQEHLNQLRERERRIEDLQHSLSWKLTAPLRAIYGVALGKRS